MYTYKTKGTCSREIQFSVEDSKVKNIKFVNGCPGNTVGVAMLANGRNIDEVIMLLEGIPITEEGLLEMEALTAALPWLVGLILYAFSLVGLSLAGLVLLCVYRKKIVFAPAPLELPGSSRLRTVWCNVGMILSIAGCLVMIGISLFA